MAPSQEAQAFHYPATPVATAWVAAVGQEAGTNTIMIRFLRYNNNKHVLDEKSVETGKPDILSSVEFALCDSTTEFILA